jgi:hypothetical protein
VAAWLGVWTLAWAGGTALGVDRPVLPEVARVYMVGEVYLKGSSLHFRTRAESRFAGLSAAANVRDSGVDAKRFHPETAQNSLAS